MGAPTACGRGVSGALSLPSRGAFHLSLTVLVHYRSSESVQPWRVVPPASRRVSRVRRYSGTGDPGEGPRVRGSHPLRPAFPCRSARTSLCHWMGGLAPPPPPAPQPPRRNAARLMRVRRFGLGPLSLAATRGISVDFSSSGYLDVSVPRVAPVRPMGSGGGARAWPLAGSPIRRSPDRGPCAPPRGLSQLAASFVDFRCQGIRLAPLVSSSRGPRLGPASAIRVLLLKLHLSLHGCFFVPPGPARRPGGPDVKSRYRETQTHRRPAAAAAGP